MNWSFTQYQIKAEPPPGSVIAVQRFESAWHQAWSEPVRQLPGVRAYLQQVTALQTPTQPNPTFFLEGWFSPFSDPVRVKLGLKIGDQPFLSHEPIPPEFMEIEWYANLSAPVRLPIGLKAPYQQFFAYHPRVLPKPNVTARMAATEFNSDIAIFDINVYNPSPTTVSLSGANVSVVEVIPGSGPVSIREDQ